MNPVRKLNSVASRSFRGEESTGYPEPGAIPPYQPPPLLVQYRGLAIVFAILGVALAAYFIKSVLTAPKPAAPPVQSVYIEVVPQKAEPARAPAGTTTP
jgi:hypothetical protein